jgi:hypothetical protein
MKNAKSDDILDYLYSHDDSVFITQTDMQEEVIGDERTQKNTDKISYSIKISTYK